MNEFETVYTITDHSPLLTAVVALATLCCVLGAWFYYRFLVRSNHWHGLFERGHNKPGHLVLVLCCFGLLGLVFTWVFYTGIERPYVQFIAQYEQGQYNIVEGIVHVYSVQPREGHGPLDLVEVNETLFEINYYSMDPGYHQTIAHGGVLQEGAYVRVYYVRSLDRWGNNQTTILRIDIPTIRATPTAPLGRRSPMASTRARPSAVPLLLSTPKVFPWEVTPIPTQVR